MPSPSVNYSFAFNGWVFGGVGSPIQLLSVNGLDSLPDVRTQDSIRGYADGLFTGRDFASGRTIDLELQVMGNNSNTARYYVNELRTNLIMQQYGTGVLEFKLPDRNLQYVNARVRARDIVIDPNYVYGRIIAKVRLTCPDPRIYDSTTQSAVITTPATSSGRVYNRIYNMLYVGTGGGSTTACTNSGSYTTYPIFTITGPCTNPIIVNSTTGQKLAFNIAMASSSETLVVNPDLRTVVLNGSPARNLLTGDSSWFGMPAGTTNIGFIAAASGTGASLTVQWHNAYL